eukprot:augustus_masked-scaffold_4-processed-gene-6.54-mRNA-1 protein AED:0.31 eAED:0.32 QI:0/-1/0/1/-1/1/1/0/264
MVICDTDSSLLSWTCSYCTEAIAPMPRIANPLTDITVVRGGDDKGFVGYDAIDNKIVASFRNTQGFWQLVDLINIGLVSTSYCQRCRVAESFLDAWVEVREGTLKAIESLSDKYGTDDILITGHSLGGAMGHHCAAELLENFGDRFNIIGYTFGAPRVGNQIFANWFYENFPNWFRVVNYYDPVPNIIPSSDGDYVHAPQEIWYHNPPTEGRSPRGYKVLSDSDGEDPDGQVSSCDAGNLFKICLNFDHHYTYMNFYDDEELQC